MFAIGFKKIAVSYANLTPEEISERVSEKYPYEGATWGAAAGAAAGAVKKLKGSKRSGALAGAAAGATAGVAVGHGRKKWNQYKSRRLTREIHEYNLRATPRRYHSHEEE